MSQLRKRKLPEYEFSEKECKAAKTEISQYMLKDCSVALRNVDVSKINGVVKLESENGDEKRNRRRSSRSKTNGFAESSPLKESLRRKKIVKFESSDEDNQTLTNSDDDNFKPTNSSKLKKSVNGKKYTAKGSKSTLKTDPNTCQYCGVSLNDEFLMFADKRSDAFEETMLVGNPKFHLDDAQGLECRLSDFYIYDLNEHICRLKSGVMESDNHLMFSGYVRRIDDDGTSNDGIYIHEAGPISSWWISGFDGGDEVLVAVSTAIGDYYLSEPSSKYLSYYQEVLIKAFLIKYVIELLEEDSNASFTELLEKIQSITPPRGLPPMSAETLITHGQFIISQIISYDAAADQGGYPLILTPCIRELMKFSSATINCSDVQGDKRIKKAQQAVETQKKPDDRKATTTPLIFKIMQECDVFQAQISDNDVKERCGDCVKCRQPDCGKCSACIENKSKKKHQKKYCLNKMCLALAIKEVEEVESDDENIEAPKDLSLNLKKLKMDEEKPKKARKVKWIGKPVITNEKKEIYLKAELDGKTINANDYVTLSPKFANEKLSVAKVIYMFEDKKGKQFHAHYFRFSRSTLLGHMAAENELCVSELCADLQMQVIKEKCDVEFKEVAPDWRLSGGGEHNMNGKNKNGNSFYYQKWYEEATTRYIDLPFSAADNEKTYTCGACDYSKMKSKLKVPQLDSEMESLSWMGTQYKIGDCVFFTKGDMCISSKTIKLCAIPEWDSNVDEGMYPEYYRKRDTKQGLFLDSPRPYVIGQITEIKKANKISKPSSAMTGDDIQLELEILYRPEETSLPIESTRQLDYNILYWTGIVQKIRLSAVAGKCFVVFGTRLNRSDSLSSYFAGGPNRFYFLEGYNKTDDTFFKVSKQVEDSFSMEKANLISYPTLKEKLKALDVFCGCGGLSEGFHQSGLIETKWAIENNKYAAEAFTLNNPDAIVFNDDCNSLLKLMIEGKTRDAKSRLLPKKGEVDIILGGPPCQGYSGMNRFNHRQYSAFKNSLVVTYLSYVEYFRPRFFLLENVRNFASFKKGDVLKCCIRALTEMGYQVAFGILQAGNYGVPQTRKRAFVIAAAPGEKLPLFPEPSHVFLQNSAKHSVRIDGVEYRNNISWTVSAPYRQVTLYDSISDLPPISNGDRNYKMKYAEQPKTQFQRMVRSVPQNGILFDHVCKEMNALNVARFKHIPVGPGCDWRDLPNIELALPDGTKAVKLQYKYDDRIKGKANNGAKRGVCLCAEVKNFTGDHINYAQDKTLIPWCLPHTSNRHNNWAGLFGRLHWYGYFGTTITNPEPMGKMGYVIHPEQDRVVSVRECARSQGFPDSYKFTGPNIENQSQILEKHKQIGNAVPPPLAKAIANEILKCVTE